MATRVAFTSDGRRLFSVSNNEQGETHDVSGCGVSSWAGLLRVPKTSSPRVPTAPLSVALSDRGAASDAELFTIVSALKEGVEACLTVE